MSARGLPGSRVDAMRAVLARAFPDTDVRVLHAIAETEASVVLKVRSAVFALAIVIFGITILCVTGNFSALVLERSQEIGILKAIGAAETKIAALFLSACMGSAGTDDHPVAVGVLVDHVQRLTGLPAQLANVIAELNGLGPSR